MFINDFHILYKRGIGYMSNIPLLISAAMKMEGSYVASVVLTGLAVVFLALLLLIIVFKFFGVVFFKKPKVKKVRAKAAKNEPPKVETKSAAVSSASSGNSSVSAPAAPMIEDGIDTEIVAVIAAAIAAMGAQTGKKLGLVSVKKSGASRRAWAQAGLNDNTRPF